MSVSFYRSSISRWTDELDESTGIYKEAEWKTNVAKLQKKSKKMVRKRLTVMEKIKKS